MAYRLYKVLKSIAGGDVLLKEGNTLALNDRDADRFHKEGLVRLLPDRVSRKNRYVVTAIKRDRKRQAAAAALDAKRDKQKHRDLIKADKEAKEKVEPAPVAG